jgi:hypothetical protein
MHAYVERNQVCLRDHRGIEPLQREIETMHREARALEQRRRLCERERLPPQLVGIDQNDLERPGYLDFGRSG